MLGKKIGHKLNIQMEKSAQQQQQLWLAAMLSLSVQRMYANRFCYRRFCYLLFYRLDAQTPIRFEWLRQK